MVETCLKVAVLEPYYGGSHAAFVETVKRHSRHRCDVVTMPARKWKWRMRGAALWLVREKNAWFGGGDAPDVILCNDMLSVSDLRALLPPPVRQIPVVCYFHENQLTYPLSKDDERDYQFGMTNITSCLAADAAWFNSRFHRDAFLDAAGGLLRKMPDCVPSDVLDEIGRKSRVLPPPIDVAPVDPARSAPRAPLTILWCHRWEYDKNPEPFFEALLRLDEQGLDFDLILAGERFREAPRIFASSWGRLERHICETGYAADRDEYLARLARCDVVVSTAIQENFGIAVLEAILSGCQPLLPNRLAYPEVIPPEFHEDCLFPDDNALLDRLRGLIAGRGLLSATRKRRLQSAIHQRFGARTAVAAIDNELTTVANLRCREPEASS